jgi:hypothetical protein
MNWIMSRKLETIGRDRRNVKDRKSKQVKTHIFQDFQEIIPDATHSLYKNM